MLRRGADSSGAGGINAEWHSWFSTIDMLWVQRGVCNKTHPLLVGSAYVTRMIDKIGIIGTTFLA